MLQSKHVSWLTGYKNKAHIYAACKKLTSNLKTHRWKVRRWRKIFHVNKNEKKAGVALLRQNRL